MCRPSEDPHRYKLENQLDPVSVPNRERLTTGPIFKKAQGPEPTGGSNLQAGFAVTTEIQEGLARSAKLIRDNVQLEEETFRREEPEKWARRKENPGLKKLMRILDELEGKPHGIRPYGLNNEERPGSVADYKHSLGLLEEAPEGARFGEPNGTVSWNPEGRKRTPGYVGDNKERPGSVADYKHILGLLEDAPEGARFG
jgi:hypothetical protein